MRPNLLLLCSVALGTALPAQSVVVPVEHAVAPASGMRWLAGAGVSLRQQLVIDGSHLAGAVGRDLVGLAFRRDNGHAEALPSGRASWKVRISSFAGASVAEASEQFEANLSLIHI